MSKHYVAGIRLLDGLGGAPQERVSILIEDAKIAAIGPAGDVASDGAQVHHLDGMTVLPGLINAHEHLAMKGLEGEYYTDHRRDAYQQLLQSARSGMLLLSQGVTTVRDCGAFERVNLALRQGIKDALSVGPEVVCCGQVIQPAFASEGVQPLGMTVEADSAEQTRQRAHELIEAGVDFVKLKIDRTDFTSGQRRVFTVEEVRGAVDAAHEAGLPAACQAMYPEEIEIAIRAGIDSLEHGLFLHDGPDIADLMASKGIWYVPCYNSWAVSKKATQKRRDAHLAGVADAVRAGVKLAVGTDLYAKDMVAEMEAFLDVGLTARQAITAATRHGAELIGSADEKGTVEVGKRADLLVVNGDPERDLTLLRRPELVFKDGTPHDPVALYRLISGLAATDVAA